MNLNDKLNFKGNKKTYLIISLIILVVALICVFFFIPKSPVENGVKPPALTLEIEESPIITPEPEVSQDEVLGIMTGLVTNTRNLSTKFEYTVLIGKDDASTEAVVTANLNTVLYDLNKMSLILASDIKIGDKLVIYGKGSYVVGNVIADVIAIGEDTTYRYDTIKEIEGNISEGYLWKLFSNEDKLSINSDCRVINGYTGIEIANMNLILENSKVLYKYLPDFDITDSGNIYYCTDIIILDLGEQNEESK